MDIILGNKKMDKILEKIALCVEKGKINTSSPHPPEMQRQEGVDELTRMALDSGLTAQDVLSRSLIAGMKKVGEKFRRNQIYLPDVLMAARAMDSGMEHLKPFFISGNLEYKGKIVLGTVAGDLHDIGKKIVGMFFEGGGWEVIDCGIDVASDTFLVAIKDHQPRVVGLSALLTTTMVNMADTTKAIKSMYPNVRVIVGGAPVTHDFAEKIGADMYSPDPQGALDALNKLVSFPEG
jgi:5-methyltetrahydrofolate--homocysteine methyltransferase